MASTSTGYNKSVISREQPTSSGQVESFTSGCTLNIQGGAEQNVESGAYMNVESGAYFSDQNIQNVTASGVYGTTVTARGVIYMNPTSSGNVTIQLSSMKKLGQRVVLLVANSTKKKARVVTGNTLITFACSSGQQLVFTTEASNRPFKVGGVARAAVELLALTTKRWCLLNMNSTVNGYLDISTGRTS